MARKSDTTTEISTTVKLPRELHARLQDAARERVVGVGLLMTIAIEQFLDELPPVESFIRKPEPQSGGPVVSDETIH